MRNKWFKIPLILLGNAVFAFGIAAFILPCGLLSGGTTGIALFIQHLCGLPVVITVWVINLSMLLLDVYKRQVKGQCNQRLFPLNRVNGEFLFGN